MSELRLKSYKTYLNDGRSNTVFDIADKSRVFVAIILGDEPAQITDESQYLDVDAVILKMAARIRKVRKERKQKPRTK